ncbi:MAG: hypothetical protein L6R38_005977 [Xanthoria sp. 2 TBL-2021]|nr:MAG: hypothetical protein L6R38_005977 [Xanthoria sp. 2 TBL-2021]
MAAGGNSILPGQEQTMRSSNLCSMKSDHQQGLVFEHWSDGKPPATASGSTNTATYKCDVEDCDKAFVRKGDLSRHLKSHKSGPRAHNCLADGCPRKGLKGFWRVDKFKDHMDRKHPEIEFERWVYYKPNVWVYKLGGYRDVEKREQHEALMLSKGYKPRLPGSVAFRKLYAWERAAV